MPFRRSSIEGPVITHHLWGWEILFEGGSRGFQKELGGISHRQQDIKGDLEKIDYQLTAKDVPKIKFPKSLQQVNLY